MATSQNRSRPLKGLRSFLTLAVCGVCLLSVASAGPIAKGIDSYQTLDSSFGIFSDTPIPADFFDPGSDPFMDTIACQGVPLAPGATTDTLIQRQAKAQFPNPSPSSDTVPIQITALSLTNVFPITVTYNGGATSEVWNVHVDLSVMPQPVGSMTINDIDNTGGDLDWILPVLPRFTFTRVSDGATRVFDFGSQGLPSLDFHARAVPWTHKTSANVIHTKKFCPGCDSPDGTPIEINEQAQSTSIQLFPASTVP